MLAVQETAGNANEEEEKAGPEALCILEATGDNERLERGLDSESK